VQCAADTWVQVTEHAADGGGSSSSNGSQLDAVQQAAVLEDYGSGNSSSGAAGEELLAAVQQANSSTDLQLQLDWRPRQVQGFTVQPAEAREVFRTLEQDSSSSSSSSSSSRRIQYWDAFAGAWQEMQLPSAGRVLAGDAVAVTAG
jgi:hypothetical protein